MRRADLLVAVMRDQRVAACDDVAAAEHLGEHEAVGFGGDEARYFCEAGRWQGVGAGGRALASMGKQGGDAGAHLRDSRGLPMLAGFDEDAGRLGAGLGEAAVIDQAFAAGMALVGDDHRRRCDGECKLPAARGRAAKQ